MLTPIDERTRRVFKQMERGLPPSLIDAKLGYNPGEAHDLVVAHWAHDMEAAKLFKSTDRYRKQ